MIKSLFQKAEDFFNKADYEAAIEALLQVAQLARQTNDWAAFVRAQNELGIVHKYLSKNQKAFDYLFEAQKIGEKHLPSDDFNIAQTYDMLGCVYGDEHQFEQSNDCFIKALDILQHTNEHPRELANTYNNLGWCLSEMGKYAESLAHHQSALTIRLQSIEKYPNEVAQSYNNMGACYIFIGDTNTALIYYQKALNIWLNQYGENHPQTANAYNNIGWSYSQQADFKMAIQFYEKALQLRENIFDNAHPLIAQCLENIAYCLMKREQFEEALQNYQKGLQIRCMTVHENHPSLIKIYRNLGECFLEMEKHETAFEYLQKAIQLHQQTPNQAVEKIVIHNTLGKYYDETKQYEKAIEAFHTVLQTAIPSFNDTDVYAVPSLEKYYHGIKLGYALNYKAKVFLTRYLQTENERDLEASMSYFKKSIQVLNENRRRYKTEDSKLIHAKLVVRTYEFAIYTAYLYYQKSQNPSYFHTAFAFAELSKSYVLFSKLKETAAKISANIPSEILQKEQNLQTELTSLDKRIQQLKLQIKKQTAASQQEKEKQIRFLQDKYFDLSFQYDQIIEEIEQNYPQYYQLKYDLQTADTQQIQQELSASKTLVNYFVGTEHIFIFAISKQSYYFYQFEKPEDLGDTIEYVHDAIGMGDEEDLKDLGEQLYEQLLQPVLSKERDCKELVIIPDDYLHRLPFDVLVDAREQEQELGIRRNLIELPNNANESPKYPSTQTSKHSDSQTHNHPSTQTLKHLNTQTPKHLNTQKHYLIEACQISYHYSATLWLEGQKNKMKEKLQNSFLGVAPIKFDEITQIQLPTQTLEHDYQHKNPNTETTFKSDFDSDGKLKDLTDSKAEIQKIHQLFAKHQLPSTALLYEEATKQNFIQNLKEKKYIVLSSHGFYNKENPILSGIYFSRGEEPGVRSQAQTISDTIHKSPITNHQSPIEVSKLYISDTFHLPLDADLVVLSSCESGIGELQKGEGMMALNRGFLYAGANNIIYSLFKVPDAASQLTPNFFRSILEENCSYAEALQKAKLDLIAEGAEPLYWAGFALVGR